MKFVTAALVSLAALAALTDSTGAAAQPAPASWTADNGNGTYTNPIFQDEFSDPDIIRVGDEFYMTGTTMHSMPGLPVFRSRDLVNWELLTYAFDRLDLGPEYRLEGGQGAYGKGIWAPCIRHHDGTFYIFANVNGYSLQIFSAKDPAGPWTKIPFEGSIHDPSILFDDDGKVYAVYGYDTVRMVELKSDLSGIVEGSERIVIPAGNGVGEGHHFYKIDDEYLIISANYAPIGRMQASRAKTPYGPYETVTVSSRETMGLARGNWASGEGISESRADSGAEIVVTPSGDNALGANPLHQGGIVQLPNGDWWGFSMMDVRSAGRMTYLSPITWKDGWPYFGLPGNLGRSPKTWIKPEAGEETRPRPPFERNDDFSEAALKPVWQWNHVPVDEKWSLAEKRGVLRLHTLPAGGLFEARNSLTQRVMGPASSATVTLDASGLAVGDVAGLALFGYPYYWIGVARTDDGLVIRMRNRLTGETIDTPTDKSRVTLRAGGDYEAETAELSYSLDGRRFTPVGGELVLAYQLKTFQGYRYALFAFNEAGGEGGHADFDDFRHDEPLSDRRRNIPLGKAIRIENFANGERAFVHPLGVLHAAGPGSQAWDSDSALFTVRDRGNGRVALEAADGSGFVTVVGVGMSGDVRMLKEETEGALFQWQDMLRGQFMLLSLKTHRYLGLDPTTGEPYSAESPGADPNRKDGGVLVWSEGAAPRRADSRPSPALKMGVLGPARPVGRY